MAFLFALLAFIFAALLGLAATLLFQAKSELKDCQENARAEIERTQQQAKADLARYQGIADLEKYQTDLQSNINKARKLLPKFQSLAEMEEHRAMLTSRVAEFQQADSDWQEKISMHQATLERLRGQLESVEETLDMQSFGFYRPKYGFEDSQQYANELQRIRDSQKAMVKAKSATHCPQDWMVDGDIAKGRKMIEEHSKLMLRAFNGECDAAISKVKFNNANNLENRINRSFEAINKLGKSKQLWITQEYANFKLQELYLVHEHRRKVEEEREEQRRIKEEMREEEKARREIEKARKEAEQEEAIKAKALEKARKDLSDAHGAQTDRLKAIVDKLEFELKEALERKAKSIARAQLTKSGHVYVLSNIGAFGEGVYKIGMTRRLEPLDRVKELGDASVPFPFDVHAMIYSEDAPALENTLHKHFDSRRVNLVNLRREYFHVTLDEIQSAVEQHFGVITFVTVPPADEYRETIAKRSDMNESVSEAHISNVSE